ncbi:MAG: efflux RND transporter periplasmic adaptor subunit [Pirellulaceae bacterium]
MNFPYQMIERWQFWPARCRLRSERCRALPYVVVVCLSIFAGAIASPAALYAQGSPLVYDGFTEPIHDILVAANEIGRVDQVMVEEGDQIREGDTIAKLEDSVQAASVRIAEMQCQMTGEIDAAKAELETNLTRVKQLRELADERMAPPTELARAEADLQIAQARLKTVLERLELQKLELERYRVQLQRRLVIAPRDGIVATVFHQPGEYVTPGDPAVIRLLVTKQLHAVINVPVDELYAMSIGTETQVFLRGSGATIQASVCSLAPSIDGESGTVKVRVLIPNEDGKLRAGDRCTVQVASSRSPQRHQSAAVQGQMPVRSARLDRDQNQISVGQQIGGNTK